MKNDFEIVFSILEEFKNSDIPEYRLKYVTELKGLIEDMKRMLELVPNKEAKENIDKLESSLVDYKLYPKL